MEAPQRYFIEVNRSQGGQNDLYASAFFLSRNMRLMRATDFKGQLVKISESEPIDLSVFAWDRAEHVAPWREGDDPAAFDGGREEYVTALRTILGA